MAARTVLCDLDCDCGPSVSALTRRCASRCLAPPRTRNSPAIRATDGNKAKAAALLAIDRTALYEKLKVYIEK